MHTATLWEITLAADTIFATPVFVNFSTTYLTSWTPTGLLPSTDYLIRATYFDNLGNSSGPGAATAFTTLAANTSAAPGTFLSATQGCGDC